MTETISPLNPILPARPGITSHWGGLYGSAKSLALINAVRIAGAPLVVLTPSVKVMENMQDELRFYHDNEDEIPVLTFPDWETLPYDQFSPYQDIISERLSTLSKLSKMKRGILLVPVSTMMQRLMPVEYLRSRSLELNAGEHLDVEEFRDSLLQNGYRYVSQVMEHGDLTIRGSILDIYPMGSLAPYRIDLLDDIVDSIRIFDPETQRSINTTTSVSVLPASEVSLTKDCTNRFRAAWRDLFSGNPANQTVYADVSNGMMPAGIEYFLPLFYENTSLLFDYLPEQSVVVIDEDTRMAADTYWHDVNERYDRAVNIDGRQVLPPEQLFLDPDGLNRLLKSFPGISLNSMAVHDKTGAVNYATRTPVNVPVDVRNSQPLSILNRFIDDFKGRILLVAESPGRRETIMELFRNQQLQPQLFDNWAAFADGDSDFGLTVSPLEQGALLEKPAIAVISESQLFGERVQQRRLRKRRQSDTDAIVRSLAELTEGAPVVHEEHGVGRYLGLVTLELNGILNEFISMEYDRGDKLYVPVSSLDLISRYTGADAEHAPLHRLGSGQWQKARKRAEKRIHDIAAELLELHARRAARSGNSFHFNENEYRSFVEGFPFEETPDQQDAIDAVIKDMVSERPMDRLVCGDAGFGKTEVAMRAAFISISNNRQVVLLVPTTLLARQHYQNFRDRFADWPVRIDMMSRFASRKEQNESVRDLDDGKVDIIIGTHRLLQDDIRFKRLGLVIIDEEHRFGVRQKEKIKALRAEVDILTLTATPIPRTLNMAVSELRDLSIIATPPSRRLAIKTFVYDWKDSVVQEAMQREIQRGGQVYFLHNEVDTIEKMSDRLQQLAPDARVRYAHGQMPEKQLEQVMMEFYHRRFNILVCSTIIESGIDVPTANTIIINRADKLGLAQLYQLRGRVGRSHHRAYAYLMVPSRQSITTDARKRLEAIESLEELGIGFTLAIHDLEIRGAGEILGDEQSGQIHEIGFSLYMELLERAVTALRAGKQPQLDRPLDHGAEIDLHVPALIPEDFLPDVHTRLIMYKRIASVQSADDLEALQEEMTDRFGLLPEQARNLFRIARLKIHIRELGVRKIDIADKGGRIQFNQDTTIDPGRIIQLIQEQPALYKLDGAEKLRIIRDFGDAESRISFLYNLFDYISARDAA